MSKQERQKRFFGLDVHKAYIMVAAVNANQEVVLKPRRVTFERFESWINKALRPSDEVVLEATTNAWHVHDLLAPHVAQVIVAHPYHVKLIAAAAVKTDKRDALALAKLLAAHMIPPVWVPPPTRPRPAGHHRPSQPSGFSTYRRQESHAQHPPSP
jgi:transposase